MSKTLPFPPGKYHGLWTAYTVDFIVNGVQFIGYADEAVKGVNVPCIVHIKDDGSVSVTVIEK